MCRYSVSKYKPHYTCFNCRKSFKGFRLEDKLKQIGKLDFYRKLVLKPIKQYSEKESEFMKQIDNTYSNRVVKCPQCQNQMADLGLDFKVPPINDTRKWKIVESLFKTGKRFYGCGCYGNGYIPSTKSSFKDYLIEILAQYQAALSDYQQKTIAEAPNKTDAIKYWKKRITQVQSELELFNSKKSKRLLTWGFAHTGADE